MAKNTNINMKRGLVLSVFLFTILSLCVVSADVTVATPASGATVSGASTAANITLLAFPNVMNCSILVKSVSTANSTWTNVSTLANTSGNQSTFNNTVWNTRNLEDSNDYSVLATCTNMTSGAGPITQNSSAVTVTVNNTIPQAPSSISPSTGSINTNGTIIITSTVTSYNTTGCLLFFVNGPNFGGNPQTMTHTGSECTIALNSTPEQTYNFIIEANDGTNRVNSSTITFSVDSNSRANVGAILDHAIDENPENRKALSVAGDSSIDVSWQWVIAILVLIVVIYAIAKK